ncbi:hypothetical protein ACWC9Q_17145 [Streptomyces sp. NPDC001142]
MVRWTAPSPVTGADGADLAAGGIPVMCRSGIAGRRATISGGAVRRGRTAAGRVRSGAAGAGAALSARRDADADADAGAGAGAGAGPGPSADAAGFVGGVPDVAPGAVAPLTRAARPGVPGPEEAGGTGAPDRWTVADPRLAPVVPRPTGPPAAGGRSTAGSALPSVAGRAARRSSGPPSDTVRAPAGRVTPLMRPTGADGITA